MKKLIMTGPQKSQVIDIPVPEIGDDQLLIRVLYQGVCTSEYDSWLTAAENDTLGHEPVGIVEKVGRMVRGFRPGDRVTGFFRGGIAQYNTAIEPDVFLIPDNLSDSDAIVEPLACLIYAVSKLRLFVPGTPVAIVGCGYMGCGMIELLKIRGAGRVIAVDSNESSLCNALRFGADEAYLPKDIPHRWAGGGKGFDLVCEWGGNDASLNTAISLTGQYGQLAVCAFHNNRDGLRTIDMRTLNLRAIDMISVHPRDRDALRKSAGFALDLLASNRWRFRNVPTRFFSMEQFDTANRALISKYGTFLKAVIDCRA